MATKVVLPPLVVKSLEVLEQGLIKDTFQVVSRLVAKHYQYPVWRVEIIYRDPVLMLDGKWYNIRVQFPNKNKPDVIHNKVDHSKTRALIFFVQDHKITENGVDVDFGKRGQKEWRKLEEKQLRDHKVIVLGGAA